MRFARVQKRSPSLVTAKGRYRNSKGKETHHPRQSETPVQFVGVDGEGMMVDGEHRYVLFGVGDQQIENPEGLQWWEIFEFLYSQRRVNTAYVGFFLGYDFTQILKTLPEDRAWMLLTAEGRALRRHRIAGKAPHPVQAFGETSAWHLDILGNKRLRIRPKLCVCKLATCGCEHPPWMYVCDVGPFFQSSFLKVIDPKNWKGAGVVTAKEYATIERGKGKRSTAVLDDEMRGYNRLENEILVRVMRQMDLGLHGIGVHLSPSKWFGPGQAAQQWMQKEKVPTREMVEEKVPPWFLEAARMSYFGGWFEIMMHGIIPGESHEYDINSAYPFIISTLPCLLHGSYTHGGGLPRPNTNSLCLVYANVWSPGMPIQENGRHIGAMLHRDPDGRILRPLATEGWFWFDELKSAERAGMLKRLDNRGKQQVQRWVMYEPCDCPPPLANVAGLYDKRLEVGKDSALGKACRIIYNSDYGKFAQSIGDPMFGNPVYASRITSGCRTQILDAIASHPKGLADVAMVATDAVYFLSEHRKLARGTALGQWDYKARTDLTLFKPGVYWDNGTRESISKGDAPSFKARGFQAADFGNSIRRIDDIFRGWGAVDIGNGQLWEWPRTSFRPSFAMTTALQALRQGDWERAGMVMDGIELVQDSDPSTKRTGLYRDDYDGRIIYRSMPYLGMKANGHGMEWVPSTPYNKRFGMEDPWSDEYKGSYGMTEDGNIIDVLAWILTGEG